MILVTGGTGFLGSHLLLELCGSGKKVRVLKRPASDMAMMKRIFSFYHKEDLIDSIEWAEGDLSDIDSLQHAMNGVEQIYHCAATVTFSAKNPGHIIANNVEGTANLINVAIRAGVKKFCHVSSIAALGNDAVITEKTIWEKKDDHSVYGRSKHESEIEAWRGIAEGLDTVIVNPSVLIGPWKPDTGIGSLLRQIRSGLKYYTGGSNGFVDVRDVAKAMVMLMDSEMKNDNFIISSENISFRDLSFMIAQLTSVKAPRVKASKWMTTVAWRSAALKSFFNGKKADFDKDTARISQSTSVFSNKKIVDALDLTFIPVKESLEHYFTFYKEQI
jgi:nucleoside-diphosphate-sugar epimerase